jgi:hypothetical protein
MCSSDSNNYRAAISELLNTFEFRTNHSRYQPIIEVLDLIKKHIGTKQKYFAVADDVPVEDVIPPKFKKTDTFSKALAETVDFQHKQPFATGVTGPPLPRTDNASRPAYSLFPLAQVNAISDQYSPFHVKVISSTHGTPRILCPW